MGKRELLIISAFVLVGIVAYQLASPAPVNRRAGFSFSSFLSSIRREARGNRSTASVTTKGTLPVPNDVSEIRLASVSRVTITGGPEPEIAYELTVESNGPDEATAQQNAARATLTEDVVGSVLSLRLTSAPNVRQINRLTMTVPARALVRITGAQGNARIEATGVSGIQLDGVVGDVRVSQIKSEVTGSHRNGEIAVSDAGAVNLTLVSSKLTVERVAGGVTLNARNGPCRIADVKGPVALDVANAEVSIARPGGLVRVNGSGGRVAIENPGKAVSVDVRRTGVSISLNDAVPVTVITTDARLELALNGTPAVAIDAVTRDGGTIDANDFSLSAETDGDELRLRHTFATGGPAVALRNQHAEIVIRRMK